MKPQQRFCQTKIHATNMPRPMLGTTSHW